MNPCNPTFQRCQRCGHTEVTAPAGVEISLYRPWHIRDKWAVRNYVASLASEKIEWVLALFIDEQLNLLSVQSVAIGDETEAEVNLPHIICRGVALHATSMIVVHNHPSGIAKSSWPDRRLTKRLQFLAHEMGIQLLDSLIVAGDQIVRIGDNASDDRLLPLAR